MYGDLGQQQQKLEIIGGFSDGGKLSHQLANTRVCDGLCTQSPKRPRRQLIAFIRIGLFNEKTLILFFRLYGSEHAEIM